MENMHTDIKGERANIPKVAIVCLQSLKQVIGIKTSYMFPVDIDDVKYMYFVCCR